MITLFTTPIKQKRLSIASVAKMANIGEESPNSIISFSYLFNTSSSVNFAVTTNVDSVNPSIFKMVSMNPKKKELVLLYNHILCSHHQPRIVPPDHRNSARL